MRVSGEPFAGDYYRQVLEECPCESAVSRRLDTRVGDAFGAFGFFREPFLASEHSTRPLVGPTFY
jgi:hypothetical protein